MVSIKIQFLLLALATFVMACLLSSHQAAAELDNDVKALTRIICCGDLIKLYRRCKEYVKKDGEEEDLKEDGEEEDPSEECCSEVQKADLPCICQYLPPIVERFIDMEKLANVAEKCERPLPSGTKCGSKSSNRSGLFRAEHLVNKRVWSWSFCCSRKQKLRF